MLPCFASNSSKLREGLFSSGALVGGASPSAVLSPPITASSPCSSSNCKKQNKTWIFSSRQIKSDQYKLNRTSWNRPCPRPSRRHRPVALCSSPAATCRFPSPWWQNRWGQTRLRCHRGAGGDYYYSWDLVRTHRIQRTCSGQVTLTKFTMRWQKQLHFWTMSAGKRSGAGRKEGLEGGIKRWTVLPDWATFDGIRGGTILSGW